MVGFGTSSSQDDQLPAGFEELAMPLLDSLYNFARWLVHNSNDAEDLVQETYLKALRSFASFQSGTNFRARMFQILRNTFLSSCSTLDRRMTVAMDSEEDGPELAVDTETPETIPMIGIIRDLCSAPSTICRCIIGKPYFFLKWRKCRTGRSRKYCRSPQEPSCHAWPGPGRRFASHS